ncbi:MAG: hypothetical protein KA451_02680 [Methyloversatilis sp.]|nr:hypothetical protein [Methyloversatilis sp.]
MQRRHFLLPLIRARKRALQPGEASLGVMSAINDEISAPSIDDTLRARILAAVLLHPTTMPLSSSTSAPIEMLLSDATEGEYTSIIECLPNIGSRKVDHAAGI